MLDYLDLAEINRQRALNVIKESGVVSAWENIGATVNLVGSLKIGVLAKHKDIDFHIYTPELNTMQSFGAIAKIAGNPLIKHIEFRNLANTDECCYEWHAEYEDVDGDLWQIDMIQIKQGSKYDGYFEQQAENIKMAMNEEMRQRIIRLKFETPENMKVPGILYYKAVIQDRICDFPALLQWLEKKGQTDGIIEW